MYVFRELLKTKLNEPQFNYFIICCPRCPATDSIVCSLFRVTLLELISAQLNEEGSDNCGVPPAVAHFLAGSFQKGCGAVLTLATGSISSDEVRTVTQAGSDSSPSICIVVFFALVECWWKCPSLGPSGSEYEPACLLRFPFRSCRRR